MKILIRNWNGILDTFIELVKSKGEYEENPHLADVLVTWQDVRGEEKELVELFKNRLNKPVIVVEHGRGATRDYCKPNNFKLLADKICVWGPKSVKRLLQTKIEPDRVVLVGCPLLPRLKPVNKRDFINILLCPVISTKEEPENVMVYAELKKWESQKLLENLYENFDLFKKNWAFQDVIYKDVKKPDGSVEQRLWSDDIVGRIPRNITYKKGFIHVKNTPIHDSFQYLAPVISSPQTDVNSVIELLRDIDVVVCLEESTLSLLAMALQIPVVVCDIFKWKDYGGCKNYDLVEKIRSPGAFYCDLSKLSKQLNIAIESKKFPQKYCLSVIEEEMGGDIALKADQKIYETAVSCVEARNKKELVLV